MYNGQPISVKQLEGIFRWAWEIDETLVSKYTGPWTFQMRSQRAVWLFNVSVNIFDCCSSRGTCLKAVSRRWHCHRFSIKQLRVVPVTGKVEKCITVWLFLIHGSSPLELGQFRSSFKCKNTLGQKIFDGIRYSRKSYGCKLSYSVLGKEVKFPKYKKLQLLKFNLKHLITKILTCFQRIISLNWFKKQWMTCIRLNIASKQHGLVSDNVSKWL